MKPIKFLLILITLLLSLVAAEAREWSGEIPLTAAMQNHIYAYTSAKTDSRGDLHLFYSYDHYLGDPQHPFQPVYQLFTSKGVPIIEPIVLGAFTELPPFLYSYDLAFDNEENVYLLWGCDSLYVTKISPDLDILIPKKQLTNSSNYASHGSLPKITISSDGNINITSCDLNLHGYEQLTFCKYTPELEFIDTLFTTGADSVDALMYYAYRQDTEDNYHFLVWKGENGIGKTRYVRLDQAGNILYDNILNTDDYWQFGFTDMVICDSNVFLNIDYRKSEFGNNYSAIAQYDPNTNTYQNRYELMSTDGGAPTDKTSILRNSNGGFFNLFEMRTDSLNGNKPFIGYVSFTKDGEIRDSLAILHNTLVNGVYWGLLDGYSNRDGVVGAVLAFSTPRWQYSERALLYSEDPQGISQPHYEVPLPQIKLQNFPNPFNNSTLITFYPTSKGDYYLTIVDPLGRQQFSAGWSLTNKMPVSCWWNGVSHNGSSVTSGSYFIRIEHNGSITTRAITLVK